MKNIPYIVLFFFARNVYSQNYIFNSISKKPIESVNIFYNQNSGLITNEDGYFELPNDIKIDTLYFSHISYKEKYVLADNLKAGDTIFLKPSTIKLDEVTISNINAKELVSKAINKIKDNYLNIPYNSYGFYRESLQEDSKGVEMVEVGFISYTKNSSLQSTKILNSRRTKSYSKLFSVIGGAFDAIKNGDFVRRRIGFLDNNKKDKYKFKYKGSIAFLNSKLYKIGFRPKDSTDLKYLAVGTLYIDSKSLAFVKIELSSNKKKLAALAKIDSKKNSNKPYSILKELNVVIEYRKGKYNKWGLFSAKLKNKLKVVYKKESYIYDLRQQLIINEINADNPKKVRTNYNLKKDFNKQVKRFDELENWNDNYRFSLSKNDRRILNDIKKQQENEKNN